MIFFCAVSWVKGDTAMQEDPKKPRPVPVQPDPKQPQPVPTPPPNELPDRPPIKG